MRKLHKNNSSKELHKIKFKSVHVEREIEYGGVKKRPDLIIEFDEPAELALKWNHRILVEIVEVNSIVGEKMEFYKGFKHGICVVEVAPVVAFNILKDKKFVDLKKKDISALERLICNYYNKEIWVDYIVDIPSQEYLAYKEESRVLEINNELKIENARLAEENIMPNKRLKN